MDTTTTTHEVDKHQDLDFSESTVYKLDENSIINIFNYLSIADRIKIERVSKTWKEIAKRSRSKIKKLRLSPKYLGLKTYGTSHQFPEINEYVIESILKRCGRYLSNIDLVSNSLNHLIDNKKIYPCWLTIVAKYCPNVKSIKCGNVSVKGIEELAEHCKYLTELSISGNLNIEFNEALQKLFSNNNNLRVLDFASFRASDKSLMKLPLENLTAAIKIRTQSDIRYPTEKDNQSQNCRANEKSRNCMSNIALLPSHYKCLV